MRALLYVSKNVISSESNPVNTHNIITAATGTGLSLLALLSTPALAQSTTTLPATLSQSVQPSDNPSAEESVPPFYSQTYPVLERLRAAKQEESKWREVIAQSPNSVEAHLNLAIALRNLARYSEAEAIYREAIRLAPDREETYTALADFLSVRRRSHYPEAIALYQKATEVAPDSARAQANLAEALFDIVHASQIQQLSPAIEAAYRKAIDLSPDSSAENVEYRFLLSHFFSSQDR